MSYFSRDPGPTIYVCCRLQHLIRQNADAIANSIVLEQGKTLAGIAIFTWWRAERRLPFLDAHGDLLRGLQVVESAAAITSTILGEKLEGTNTDIN